MWIIYVLGDIDLIEAVLNGVAMVFSAPAFRGGAFGGSAILMAMLLSLVGVLFWALRDQWRTVNPTVMLILFIVWMAGGYTRTTVIIEDVYSGSGRSVDNVPLIVAVPASLVTTAAIHIGELFQTAYSTVGGTVPVTDHGFVNPLRLMVSLRNTAAFAPDLVASYSSFAQRCVSGVVPDFFSDPNAVLNSLNTATPPPEWAYLRTYYFNRGSTEPTGQIMICDEAAQRIADDFRHYMSGPVNRQIGAGMGVSRPDGTAFGLDDFEDAWLRMSATSAADAQSAAAVLALSLAASGGYHCGHWRTTDPNAYIQCSSLLHDQQERFNIDSAAAASGFTRTMLSSMSFLLALFFGLSPLVMLVALASGPRALDLLGKYVMFGAWTQSWLPAAYLLNFFVIFKWNEAAGRLMGEHGGLTLAAVPDWYFHTAKQIGVASDLLAATPLITLAVLTGSYFALAKLGERWSQRDFADERQLQPAPVAIGSNVAVASQRVGTGAVGFAAEGVSATRLSFSDSHEQTLASRASRLEEASRSVARMTASGTALSNSWEGARQTLASAGTRDAQELASAMNYTDSISNSLQERHGLSRDVADRIQSVAKAGIMAGGSGAAMAGDFTVAGKEAHEWMQNSESGQAWRDEFTERMSRAEFREAVTSDSARAAFNLTASQRDELSNTLTQAERAGRAYEQTAALARGGRLEFAGDYNQTHQRAQPLMQEMMSLHAHLINQDEGYTSAFNDHLRRAVGSPDLGGEARDYHDVVGGVILASLQSAGHHETVTDLSSRMLGTAAGGLHRIAADSHAGRPIEEQIAAGIAAGDTIGSDVRTRIESQLAAGSTMAGGEALMRRRDAVPATPDGPSLSPPEGLGTGQLGNQQTREMIAEGTGENVANTAAAASVTAGYAGHRAMGAVRDVGDRIRDHFIGQNTHPPAEPLDGYRERVESIPR